MRIIGTNHCGELQHTSFKYRELFQDVICHCDSDGMIVVTLSHQILLEYHVGNISVPIENIVLEHFSALPKAYIS